MKEYHKIQSIFKRDLSSKKKPILEGQFTLPEFEYLAHNQWVFTEKVDGTNIRIIWQNNELSFAGRTNAAEIPQPLLERLHAIFDPLTDLFTSKFPNGVCLYGEGYGGKIQSIGHLYHPQPDFVLFDIKVGDFWLQRSNVENIAADLNLNIVPILGTGTLYDAVAQAKAGIRSTWGDFEAEGYIAVPKVDLFNRQSQRIITKIKCRDFK